MQVLNTPLTLFIASLVPLSSAMAADTGLTVAQKEAMQALSAHAGTWCGHVRQHDAQGTLLLTFPACYAISLSGTDYRQVNSYYFDEGTQTYTFEAKIDEAGLLVFAQENFSAIYKVLTGPWLIAGDGYSANSQSDRFVETVTLTKASTPRQRTRMGQFYTDGKLSSYFILDETLQEP